MNRTRFVGAFALSVFFGGSAAADCPSDKATVTFTQHNNAPVISGLGGPQSIGFWAIYGLVGGTLAETSFEKCLSAGVYVIVPSAPLFDPVSFTPGITCTGETSVSCEPSTVHVEFKLNGGAFEGTITSPTTRKGVTGYVSGTPYFGVSTHSDGSYDSAEYNGFAAIGIAYGVALETSLTLVASGASHNVAIREDVSVNSNEHTIVDFTLEAAEPPKCRDCPNAGHPVNILTGNMWLDHTDASISGLAGAIPFSRSYNSFNANRNVNSLFGWGWNSSFDRSLVFPASGEARYRGADGTVLYYYDDDLDGVFLPTLPLNETSTLAAQSGGGYKRLWRDGGFELFTSAGRLTQITDAGGKTIALTYDGSNRLSTVNLGGRSYTLTYDGYSRPLTLSAAGQLTATYTHDSNGLLTEVAYPDGTGYRYSYTSSNELAEVADFSGRMVERHTYDSGRATSSEIADTRENFTLAYFPSDLRTVVTDALGNVTTYEYQNHTGMRLLTKVTGPCTSCGGAGGDTMEYVYDGIGREIERKDSAGKVWMKTYDPATHDLLTETDPLSQTTTYTYDAQGRLLTRTGPDGAETVYVQSVDGPTNVTQDVTSSTTRATTIAYHTGTGKPETITDPRGKVTTMAYHATTGDLTSVTDPLSHATTFGYDSLGRRTTVTDALSHVTTTAYDIRGRVTSVINHDATHTDFTYDKSGRRETVMDPLGRTTRYVYNEYGRLSAVVDPLNQSTRYAYDLMGNLLSLTDAKGQKTTFEYDTHNRVKKTIYPGGAYETFTYDTRGRLTTMVDRKSVTTTYAYDDLGRLTGKTFSDSTPAFSYTYDVMGRMLTAANGTDTLMWTYNLAGELKSEQSVKNSSMVAYTYDDGGNRLTVSLDGTLFVTYAYDDASRLTSITRGSSVFGFGYDNANRRTSMTYPNGVDTAYTYDNLNRLTNLAATKTSTSTPITNFGYTYDAAGNRTQKSTLDYTEDYGYDPLYRLTRADRTNPGATPPNQWTWSYDAVGNRTSAQKDQEATTSTHNEKNQLLSTAGGGKMLWRGTLSEPGVATFNAAAASINDQPARMLAGNVFEAELNLPTGANTVTIQAQDGSGNTASKSYSVNVTGGGATYTYDANGNLATKTESADVWVYTWNALNQLTAVTKNAATVATYEYDPRDRRVERLAGSTATAWTYVGEDIFRQSSTATGFTTTRFLVHGPGLDEPLAQEEGGATTYLHADLLGSIVRHSLTSGSAAQTIAYDAWGAIQAGTPGTYAFTAREWDSSAQLYYYRARFYDSFAGRFIGQDPIGFRGGINLYAYAENTPVLAIDPLGMKAAVPDQPVVTCSNAPIVNGKPAAGGAWMCCKDGAPATCLLDQEAAKWPPKYRTCLLMHEKRHIEDYDRNAPTCPSTCSTPSCSPLLAPLRVERHCEIIEEQYQCMKGSGEPPWEAKAKEVADVCATAFPRKKP